MPTAGGTVVTLTGTNFGPSTVRRYDPSAAVAWPAAGAGVAARAATVAAVYSAVESGVAAVGCVVTQVHNL
jgi:hypothetical protein